VTQQIVVLDFPIPSFVAENDTACVDAPVMISYTGGAASESAFQWNFDGAAIQSGSGMGPYQLSWNTPGIKTVSLSLNIDGIQTQTIIQEVLILDVPVAQFEMAQTVCSGSEIQVSYTASTGINSQFQWDFDGAQMVSGEFTGSPVVQWDSAGTFTASLSVADAMCISAPMLVNIQVNPTPVLDVDMDSLVCLGTQTEVAFTGTAGEGASYSWNFGNADVINGSAAGPFTLAFGSIGLQTLYVSVEENECFAGPLAVDVNVQSLPEANAGLDLRMCSGDSVQLQPNVIDGYSYSWSPSNMLSNSNSSQPWVSAAASGNEAASYNFALTVSDGQCVNTDTVAVNVFPIPNAHFTAPAAQCMAVQQFNFAPDNTFSANAIYAWNLGPHALAHTPGDREQLNIQFDVAGTHTLSLRITDEGCTSEWYTDSVTVFAQPIAAFSALETSGCMPFETYLTANDSAGVHSQYKWLFGDGSTGMGAEVSHTYSDAGYMSVTLTVTDENGCVSTQAVDQYIQVFAPPVAGFRAGPTDIILGEDVLELTNLAQDARYSYYVIGNDTILGATGTYEFTQPGEYEITQVVVNAEGCSDQLSRNVLVRFGTEYYIPLAFTPNYDGKNDVFKVEGSEISSLSLTIFDRWGNEVFSGSDANAIWDGHSVQTKEPLPDGVYIYQLEIVDFKNRLTQESGSVTLLR
jgi:gliding motility-associated-like protein